MEFQDRRKIRKRLYSRTTLVIVVVILVILVRPTWNIVQKYFSTSKELNEAELKLQELKDREILLESEKEELKSELGVEREILSKFDLAREGESVAVIISQNEGEEDIPPEPEGFWGSIKQFFGGFFNPNN